MMKSFDLGADGRRDTELLHSQSLEPIANTSFSRHLVRSITAPAAGRSFGASERQVSRQLSPGNCRFERQVSPGVLLDPFCDISEGSDVETNNALGIDASTLTTVRPPSFCLLDPKVTQEMEAEMPGMMAWLASWRGILSQAVLILIFLVGDVVRNIAYSWAIEGVPAAERPIPGIVTGMKAAGAIVFSFTLSASTEGWVGAQECVPTRQTLWLVPIGSLATLSTIASLHALDKLDAATFKLLMQVGLLTTALVSYFVLGRRYSCLQVLSLTLSLLAMLTFCVNRLTSDAQGRGLTAKMFVYQDVLWVTLVVVLGTLWLTTLVVFKKKLKLLQVQLFVFSLAAIMTFLAMSRTPEVAPQVQSTDADDSSQSLILGGVFSLLCVLFSSFRAVLSERFLQRDVRHYNAQKVQLEWAGSPISLISICGILREGPGPNGWFVGVTWRLLFALALWIIYGHCAGFLVKKTSSMALKLISCCSSVSTYGVVTALGWLDPNAAVTFNASLVVLAALMFFSSPAPKD